MLLSMFIVLYKLYLFIINVINLFFKFYVVGITFTIDEIS